MSVSGGKVVTRLVVEGVEVPVSSVSVSGGIGSPTQAQIAVPYVREATLLKPRTYVTVWYFEAHNGMTVAPDGVLTHASSHHDLSLWKLLFVGEIDSYSYRSTPTGQVVAYSCTGMWSYLDHAKLYWGSRSLSAHDTRRTAFAGAVTTQIGKNTGHNQLPMILSRKPTSAPHLNGVSGSVISLIELAVGAYPGGPNSHGNKVKTNTAKVFRYAKGLNDFLTFNGVRLNLTHMLGLPFSDTTSRLFIDDASFKRHFRRISSSIRATASVSQLIHAVLGKTFHGTAGVLAPPYMPLNSKRGKRKVSVRIGTVGAGTEADRLFKMVDQMEKIVRTRLDFAIKVVRTAPDGVDISRWDTAQSELGATKLEPAGKQHALFDKRITGTGFPAFYAAGGIEKLEAQFEKEAESVAGSKSKLQKLRNGLNALLAAWRAPLSALVAVSQGAYLQHNLPNLRAARGLLAEALKHLRTGRHGIYKTTEVDAEYGDRLHAYLLMPDLYMAPPPKCNTIFPNQITSVTLTRRWLTETTRLWLFTRYNSGRDKKNMYFAPNVDMLGFKAKSKTSATISAKEAVTKGHRFIMDHERFTGIIPDIRSADEDDAFGRIMKAAIRSKRVSKKEAENRTAHTKNNYLQRAANYYFYLSRFASRQCTVTGQYMPNLVPGLPALVLDHALADDAATPHTARHILGMVSSVSHGLADGHTSTTVQLTKCRYHDEHLDLFQERGQVRRDVMRRFRRKLTPTGGGQFVVPHADGALFNEKGDARIRRKLGALDKLFMIQDHTTAVSQQVYNATGPSADVLSGTPVGTPVGVIPLSDYIKTEARVPGSTGFTGRAGGPLGHGAPLALKPGAREYARVKGRKYVASVKNYNDQDAEQGLVGRDREILGYGGEEIDPSGARFVSYRYNVLTDGPNGKQSSLSGHSGVVVDIYESGTSSKEVTVTYDNEDLLTPPWFDASFYASNIGKEYYDIVVGCPSIIDEGTFTDARGAEATEGIGVRTTASRSVADVTSSDVLSLDPSGAGDFDSEGNLVDEAVNVTVQLDVEDPSSDQTFEVPRTFFEKKHSILDAAEHLARTWVEIRNAGGDVPYYTTGYIARKYAGFADMFAGNANLDIDINTRDQAEALLWDPKRSGFHAEAFYSGERRSRAVWGTLDYDSRDGAPIPANALLRWDGSELIPKFIKPSPGETAKTPVSPTIDVREERYIRAKLLQGALLKRRTTNDE